MRASIPDLSAPEWTPGLVQRLERAATCIARLDARLSVSSARKTWFDQACMTGFAAALRAQRVQIDEINIFSEVFAVSFPERRPPPAAVREDLQDLPRWQKALRSSKPRHWAEALPFTFDPPPGWGERPALCRALELTARACRIDSTTKPWLAFPSLLQDLAITQTSLPCMVPADPALRSNPWDTKAITPRYLKALAALAEDGSKRLAEVEADRLRAAAVTAAARRPAALLSLLALLDRKPVLAPRELAASMGLTVSGAGKLLDKAAKLGLTVEVSGRQSWRMYVRPATALALGLVSRSVGRPPSPALPDKSTTDELLADFDAALAEFSSVATRFGIEFDDDEADR